MTISFWSWPNHYGQVQINLVRPKPFWTDQNCFGHIEGQGINEELRTLNSIDHCARKALGSWGTIKVSKTLRRKGLFSLSRQNEKSKFPISPNLEEFLRSPRKKIWWGIENWSREIFGETETMKMATRRDQNFGEPEEERFILHSPGEWKKQIPHFPKPRGISSFYEE